MARPIEVATLQGPFRALSPKDIGWSSKDRHGFTVLPSSGTREEAEQSLTDATQRYTASTWPGGMVTGTGLVHWTDDDTWSGVYETYYSFS